MAKIQKITQTISPFAGIFLVNKGNKIATISDHTRIDDGKLDYLNLNLRLNQYPSLIRTDEGFIDIYGNTYFEHKSNKY